MHSIAHLFLGYLLVSRGQTLFSRRGVIACSISAPRETGALILQALTLLRENRVWPRETRYLCRLVRFALRANVAMINHYKYSEIY